MKKLFSIVVIVAGVLCITAMIIDPASAVKGGGNPIPEAVNKIAKKSCINCHTEPGNGMALAHVNLSNWDKYSPEKQASKAEAMCKMVTKGKMPPKKFKESHPEGVPTPAEIKTICDWAESLKVTKK